MAIEGHPFLTRALDRQRARQRAMLRGIPDLPLRASNLGPPRLDTNAIDSNDRSFVEKLVRNYIDEHLTDPVASVLEDLRTRTDDARLWEFVSQQVGQQQLGDKLRAAHTGIQGELSSRRLDTKDFPEEMMRDFAKLILALGWADALADDYQDPRLKALPMN